MAKVNHRIAVAMMFAAFAAIAAVEISSLSAWYDEGVTLLQVAGNAAGPWPESHARIADLAALLEGRSKWASVSPMLLALDVHPPFYYYAALAWGQVFGEGIGSLRAMSLVAVFAGGVLAVRMASSLGRFGGLAAAAVLVWSPAFAFAAVNVRGYLSAELRRARSVFARTISFAPLLAAAVLGSTALHAYVSAMPPWEADSMAAPV